MTEEDWHRVAGETPTERSARYARYAEERRKEEEARRLSPLQRSGILAVVFVIVAVFIGYCFT